MEPVTPYGHGGGIPTSSMSAATRLPSLTPETVAAPASPYGSCDGGAVSFGSPAGHQAPSSATEPDIGSSAYAPVCGPQAGHRSPVLHELPPEISIGRRGPEDDENDEEELCDEDEVEHTTDASPGPSSQGPIAGASSSLQMRKKRRGAAASRCSPPTSERMRRGGPPGAGGAVSGGGASVAPGGRANTSACLSPHPRGASLAAAGSRSLEIGTASPRTRGRSAGASGATPPARAPGRSLLSAAGASSSAGQVMAAHVSDIVRSTGVGFAGVRREITTQRKEVEILNSQLRAVTKKVDDIAVLTDRLTGSLALQRRTLIAMSGDITSVLSHTVANQAAASRRTTGGAEGGGGARTGGPSAGDDAQTPAATDEQDAQWVLDLKVLCCSTAPSIHTVSGPDCVCGCAPCRVLCAH